MLPQAKYAVIERKRSVCTATAERVSVISCRRSALRLY